MERTLQVSAVPEEDPDVSASEGGFDELPEHEMPLEPLPDTMHGLAIGSLIKDAADARAHGGIKVLRLGLAVFLYLITFGLQTYFVVQTKKLVSPVEVKNAREHYGKYEEAMYTDSFNLKHIYYTVNGYARGTSPQYFNATNFENLPASFKDEICTVPMSNVPFLFAVIFIWAITVLNQMRQSFNLGLRIMFALGTSNFEDNDKALMTIDDGIEVTALPLWLKAVIVILIIIPRLFLSMFMMWLGARWLTATLGFGNILLNAVALAFIYDLSDLMFTAIVPFHSKLLTQRTLIPHMSKRERETACSMFGMLVMGVFAAALSLLYIYVLQQVLPDYKWDVARVCAKYMSTELAV